SHLSYNDGGHQWALAIDAASQVSAYRPDLIEQPPALWEEMIEMARAGRVLWPAKPVDAISTFNSLMANLGHPLPSRAGSLLARGEAQRVLELMAALASLVPQQCLAMNPPQVLDWLSSDSNTQFALCPLLYGYSNYAKDGFRCNRIRFADAIGPGPVPYRGTQLGGAGIAVSSFSAAVDEAVDYAFWIASAECQRTVYFDSGGQPANRVAWKDERVNELSGHFFQATTNTLENAWMRPRHDRYLEFQDSAGTQINRFLRREADIDATIDRLIHLHREAFSAPLR
ncbi:MAG TPA: hypothetical protein PJ982_02625, partial [Lacipirellulaceae bacterium]|nr:hypothetical protein [Lacipirellulaceae bacterium]